jgi:hypothetical protein
VPTGRIELNLPGYAHISDSDLEAIRDIIMDGLQGFPAGEFPLGSAARGEFEISSVNGVKILYSDSVRRHVDGEHKRPLDESTIPHTICGVDLPTVNDSVRHSMIRDAIEWTA